MNPSPFEPRRRPLLRRPLLRRPRFRAIPVRTLVPNIITLLALCAGLTAIRLAVEDLECLADSAARSALRTLAQYVMRRPC